MMANQEVGPEETKGDRIQIGLPRTAFPLLEELVDETPWFRQQLDAYRVAISVALARDMKPSKDESYETKFSTSSVDPDRALRELVLTLAPECGERPYDYAQRLANKGVRYLHNELVKRGRPLPEVLGVMQGSEASTDEQP
jgi:hypothetical protein